MLDVLQFIFSSFWIWSGTLVLVYALSAGFAFVIAAIRS